MSLSETDLEAIAALMKQEIESAFDVRLEPFRREVNERFDGLYKQDEKREQEYLFINEQLKRIENKVDGHEERITNLEQKVA